MDIRQLLKDARERKARIALVVAVVRTLSEGEQCDVLAEVAEQLEAEKKARQEKVVGVPERRELFLEFVNHEEFVEVAEIHGPSGEILGAKPIEGTQTAFLHLKAPDGRVIRAQIPHEDLDPVLALVIPDYNPCQKPV